MDRRAELLEKLRSEDKEEVREAVESLAEFLDGEVIKALVDTAISRKSKSILEAVRATLMSAEGNGEVICKEVVRFFEHPEPKLRQTAIDILSHHGDTCLEVVEEKLLKSEDYNMRKFALDILSQIRSEKALELIISALKDENPNVSLTALEYLRNFSSMRDRVVEAIVGFLPSVKDVFGLTTLASTIIYGNIKDGRLIEPLREKLNTLKDPMEKHWVYKVLLFLGDKDVLGEALENARKVRMEEDLKKDIEIFGVPGED
ncbi:MAG: HEAT repeat domain-containing protein [Aquificota bacterium]|nr:HEAT repeat domain-containing protein [Aquificota bacterium]